jgi:ATP-dependent exoDNAse (exonuclease V) alpha subunit
MSHDFTYKKNTTEEYVYDEIILPEGAPREYSDRATLWNTVETNEKSATALLARELNIALPRELTQNDNIKLAREYCKIFTCAGMCADLCLHDKGDGNPHAHIMITARTLKEGAWQAKTEKVYLCRAADGRERGLTAAELAAEPPGAWAKQYKYQPVGGGRAEYLTAAQAAERGAMKRVNKYPKCEQYGRETCAVTPETVEAWRAAWAAACNNALALHGSAAKIDHRSYARQGVTRAPTIHLGPAAAEMERDNRPSRRGNTNRDVSEYNSLRQLHADTTAAITSLAAAVVAERDATASARLAPMRDAAAPKNFMERLGDAERKKQEAEAAKRQTVGQALAPETRSPR